MANTALSIQRERAGAGASVVGTSNGPETPVTTNPNPSIINSIGIPLGKPTPEPSGSSLGEARDVLAEASRIPLENRRDLAEEALGIR